MQHLQCTIKQEQKVSHPHNKDNGLKKTSTPLSLKVDKLCISLNTFKRQTSVTIMAVTVVKISAIDIYSMYLLLDHIIFCF